MKHARGGFTLLEMLTVLTIFSILLGLSVGAFTHTAPRRELARNELVDKLRRARLFAAAEQSPASVILRAGGEDRWPEVTALGRVTVGTWHLEGTDLRGFPLEATGAGYEEVEDGAVGKAVHLSATTSSFLHFGHRAAFDSVDGVAVEMFVWLEGRGRRRLCSKGESFVLEVDQTGALESTVHVTGTDTLGQPVLRFESVSSESGVVPVDRWVRIAATFDGIELGLWVDDRPVAQNVLATQSPLEVDEEADLVIGRRDSPFAGRVDEFRYGIFQSETSEPLRDMAVAGPKMQTVRFAPGGELDPRFHEGPVDLVLTPESGDALRVRVGILGDVQ